MKTLMLIAFIGILLALLLAGVFMVRGGKRQGGEDDQPADRDRAMMRALALRVALSVGLFLLVWLGYALGWIQPNGLPRN